MILHRKDLKDFAVTLGSDKQFNKAAAAGYKINMWNTVAFL